MDVAVAAAVDVAVATPRPVATLLIPVARFPALVWLVAVGYALR